MSKKRKIDIAILIKDNYPAARASSPSALGFLLPNRRLPPLGSKLHHFTAVTHSTLPASSKSPHMSYILERVICEKKPVSQNVCIMVLSAKKRTRFAKAISAINSV